MAFNIFTTKRVPCFGQYHRINDLITGKLRRQKRTVHLQFLVNEFHFLPSASVLIHSSSGILAPPQFEVSVCRKYMLFGERNYDPE